jgi:hypothetical protein
MECYSEFCDIIGALSLHRVSLCDSFDEDLAILDGSQTVHPTEGGCQLLCQCGGIASNDRSVDLTLDSLDLIPRLRFPAK